MDSATGMVPTRKTGSERLTYAGAPVGPALGDFWAWSVSDLTEHRTRSALAEFIVAAGLGVATDGVRAPAAGSVLATTDGVRVAVRSAAYVQAWRPGRESRIAFDMPRTHAWDPDTGHSPGVRAEPDVHVFAVLAHAEPATIDPLNADQWVFYVVPAALLRARAGALHTIALPALEAMTAPVGFAELASAVLAALPPSGLGGRRSGPHG